MPFYDLVPRQTYEAAPSERTERFLYIEEVAQNNLRRALLDNTSLSAHEEIMGQFVNTICAIARSLDINDLPRPSSISGVSAFKNFQSHLAGVVSGLRAEQRPVLEAYSVNLDRSTKSRIRIQLSALKKLVDDAVDLPDQKKVTLRKRIVSLEEELNHTRLDFAKTFAIAASIAAVLGGTTTAAVNAPKIVGEIVRLIGHDKEAEEQEHLLLMPPPLFLPDPNHPDQKV